jgi:hypothetical protein
MCAAGEPVDDFAVPAMDAVENSDGQPRILDGNFFEGMVMFHGEMRRGKPPALSYEACNAGFVRAAPAFPPGRIQLV